MKHDTYPKQGSYLHKRAKVCFDYDTSNVVMGTILRDDDLVTVIQLDGTVDGDCRYVLGTECQYQLFDPKVDRI